MFQGGSELPKTLLLGLLTAVVTFVLLGGVYDSSDAEGHQRSTINSGRVQVPQVAGGGATVRAANTGTMGRLQASNVTPASPDDSNPLGASKQPTQPQPGGGDAGDAGDTDGGGGPVPTLQRDLERTLASIAINKAVLVTTASNEFASVLANWLCHVKRLRMKNVLVIALDKETALQVQAAGVATLWDRAFSRANGTIGTFASKSYLQAVYSKTRHQRAVLAAGYNLFFSDTDIPWTHDWVGEIAGWALADGVDIVRLVWTRCARPRGRSFSLFITVWLSPGSVGVVVVRGDDPPAHTQPPPLPSSSLALFINILLGHPPPAPPPPPLFAASVARMALARFEHWVFFCTKHVKHA